MPPCGGGAVLQGFQQEPEFQLRFFLVDPQQFEHFFLHVRVVDTDTAAADLVAVQHQVVGAGVHAGGVGL